MTRFDRIILIAVLILLAGVGLVVLVGDSSGVRVEAFPGPDSEAAASTGIRLDFAGAMQTGTVEAAFQIAPATAGKFTWAGNTLVFKPDQALTIGKSYTVTLSEGALGQNGRRVKPQSWTFRVREPQMLYLSPADAQVRGVWTIPLSGGEARLIYQSDFQVLNAAASPDGEQIALTIADEQFATDIWLTDRSGDQLTRLTDCAPANCGGPAWSPDGLRMAYERQEIAPDGGLGPSRVWIWDFSRAETLPIYGDNQILGYGPAWSLDGGRIAFFDANKDVIRVLDLETGSNVLIPSQMGEVGTFSPDGSQMVYSDIHLIGRGFFTQLGIASFSGESGIADLFDNPQEDQWPAWSPDGRYLAFGRRRLDRTDGFGTQFTLLEIDSGDLHPITDDPSYNNLDFNWDPSGRYVVFTRFNLEAVLAQPELWVYDTAAPDRPPVQMVVNGALPGWLP